VTFLCSRYELHAKSNNWKSRRGGTLVSSRIARDSEKRLPLGRIARLARRHTAKPNSGVVPVYWHAQLRRSPVVHSFGFVYSSVDLGRAWGSCRPAAAAEPLSPRVIRRQEQRGGELPAGANCRVWREKDRGVLCSPK
jgi:hypothetical protein